MFSELADGLSVLLYGMAGIFIVMGIIITAVVLLSRLGKADITE